MLHWYFNLSVEAKAMMADAIYIDKSNWHVI